MRGAFPGKEPFNANHRTRAPTECAEPGRRNSADGEVWKQKHGPNLPLNQVARPLKRGRHERQ